MDKNKKTPDGARQADQKESSRDPTETSLKEGQDAMNIERTLTAGNDAEKDKKLMADAEKWRNEG